MNRRLLHAIGLALVLFLAPSIASAQSAISGLVRDTSGAVMPGVTVEVASPVLIEKVRSAVTDDQGRYTIIDLRPGIYTVTFTLPGFNTYRQEGLELPANFTATVNAEMRVGALEESITVTGAAPVVDVQNTQRQVVLNRELMDAVPTARNYSGTGLADAGRPHEQHRRRRQPADGTDLHDRQRLAPDRHHRAGRRHEPEQPDERRSGAGLLQRRGDGGNHLPDERRHRRRVDRRRPHQHDPEGRRQHLLGSGVRRRHRRRLAGEQRHRRAAGARADHAGRASPRSRTSTSASAGRSRRTSCGSSPAGGASPPTRSFRAATSRRHRPRSAPASRTSGFRTRWSA